MSVSVKQVEAKRIFPLIRELLDTGRSVRITVTGTSMYPFLRERTDSVELECTRFESVRRGDIVLVARGDEQYVLHRVQRIEADRFYMAGDALCWLEGPFQTEQLVAVVKAVWRGERRVLCTSFLWKVLSHVWVGVFPLRVVVGKIIRRCRLLVKATWGAATRDAPTGDGRERDRGRVWR